MQIKEVMSFLEGAGTAYTYVGDRNAQISGISSLNRNRPNTICWVKNESYLSEELIDTLRKNQVVLVTPFPVKEVNCLITDYPKGVYFNILDCFFAVRTPHSIAETAVIRTKKYGKNVHIGANCYIEENVEIGDDTIIHPNVSIMCQCTIGQGCIIGPGVVIGADGFGYYFDDEGMPVKVDHFGGVSIGNRVEIGANTCIDRGTLDDTYIGDDVKIDNLVHIAHNAVIEKGALVIAGSIVCGSATVGERGYVAPGAIIKNQVTVGSDSLVGLGAVVTKDVEERVVVAGIPAKTLRGIRKGDK